MKKIILLFGVLPLFTFSQSLYKNGKLSTGSTSASGVAAPTGYTWSELQNDAGVTTVSNTTLGATGVHYTAGASSFALADDFTVPNGVSWSISKVSFYGYQTSSPATPSPFDQLRVQIYNGNPSSGGTLVFGDLSTNRLTESIDSLTYRTGNSASGGAWTPSAPGTTRRIWKLSANITGVSLMPGTYWIVWQAHATNDASAFFPPCTVNGARGLPGWNSQQLNVTTSTWTSLTDGGNPATTPTVPYDLPFELVYTSTTLPVNLTTFTGVKNGSTNKLSWTTADEKNNKGFELQRSADGEKFSTIEFISSKGNNGNSVGTLEYEFIDAKPFKVVSYYRLKQVDFDGKSTLSKVVVIKDGRMMNFEISDIYPNPAKEKVNIVVSSFAERKANFIITDLTGKVVLQQNQQIMNGENNIQLNVNSLTAGSYILKVVCDNGCETEPKKFIKL